MKYLLQIYSNFAGNEFEQLPVDEQEAIVSAKFDAVRDAADMPPAWRRRPLAAEPEPA